MLVPILIMTSYFKPERKTFLGLHHSYMVRLTRRFRSIHSIMHRLLLLLVLISLPRLSDSCGCGRRRAYADVDRRSYDIEATTLSGSATPFSTITPSHRKDCDQWEARQAACLNGGRCYVVDISEEIVTEPQCSCPANWMGDRCEKRYIDPQFFPDAVADKEWRDRMLICIGIICISLFALAFVILMIILVVKRQIRRRRKRRSYKTNTNNNGAVTETPPLTAWTNERNKEVKYDLIEINGNFPSKHDSAIDGEEKDSRTNSNHPVPLVRLDSEEL